MYSFDQMPYLTFNDHLRKNWRRIYF